MKRRRLRPNIVRTKTGCRTCRIRKIKCDEERPSCRKCCSTGRKCEWFRDNNSTLWKTSIQRFDVAPLADASYPERRSFDFFSRRTAPHLAWLFDSKLWEVTILQLSQSVKALRHAIVALSALQEAEETYGMPISKDRASDARHQFAAHHYNLAIKCLTSDIHSGAQNTRATTLVVCLVFIHIELLRGRYEESLMHLGSGLQILEDETVLNLGGTQALDDEIRNAFQRLDLQSTHFGSPSPRPRLVLGKFTTRSPAKPTNLRFSNLEQAKTLSDVLMNTSFHFVASCGELTPQERALRKPELIARCDGLADLHVSHLRALVDLTSTRLEPTSKAKRGSIIIHTYLIASSIYLAACLTPDHEDQFDKHIHAFKEIVSLAEAFLSDFRDSTPSSPQNLVFANGGKSTKNESMPSFLTDWGLILPLYFTAIKCRDSPTRHAALRALDSWRHREGFWDSALAYKIALQVVQMEEGKVVDGIVKMAEDYVDSVGSARATQRGYLGTTTLSGTEGGTKRAAIECRGGSNPLGQLRIGNTFVLISKDQRHAIMRMTRKLWQDNSAAGNFGTNESDNDDVWVIENYKLVL